MRQEFYEIYEDLYEEYYVLHTEIERSRYFPFLPPYRRDKRRLIRIALDACEHAMSQTETRDKMRPDAKHLLLINLHQMIALPLAMSRDRNKIEIKEILRKDAETIINVAKNESNNEEISGHSIISAISNTWSELKSSHLDIWG